MKLRITLLATCLLGLSGCAKDNFGCAQFPETGCRPVSDVYEETNHGVHDYRSSYRDGESDGKADHGHTKVVVSKSHKALNYVVDGDPILTKPRVLRVLFNAWEDKDKDLNTGGFVYIRLRDSEWVLTKKAD